MASCFSSLCSGSYFLCRHLLHSFSADRGTSSHTGVWGLAGVSLEHGGSVTGSFCQAASSRTGSVFSRKGLSFSLYICCFSAGSSASSFFSIGNCFSSRNKSFSCCIGNFSTEGKLAAHNISPLPCHLPTTSLPPNRRMQMPHISSYFLPPRLVPPAVNSLV